MKKQSFVLALATWACSAAFAQAPSGVVTTPAEQSNPNASGGKPAAKAETKADTKKAVGSTKSAPDPTAGTGGAAASGEINPSTSGGKAAGKAEMKVDAKKSAAATGSMDANGDGMVSRKEWNRYHSAMWNGMQGKNGMVPMAEAEARIKGGPN